MIQAIKEAYTDLKEYNQKNRLTEDDKMCFKSRFHLADILNGMARSKRKGELNLEGKERYKRLNWHFVKSILFIPLFGFPLIVLIGILESYFNFSNYWSFGILMISGWIWAYTK